MEPRRRRIKLRSTRRIKPRGIIKPREWYTGARKYRNWLRSRKWAGYSRRFEPRGNIWPNGRLWSRRCIKPGWQMGPRKLRGRRTRNW